MNKLKLITAGFLILIAVAAVFYPSLNNNFINVDDDLYVTENKAIRSISLANLKKISSSFFITHYQPVTMITYMLEYHFFKLNPFNYHLTNLLLHLLNCLLVFWMIYKISGRLLVAGLTALFFGIHPLQVESVAWVSERKNLLYAFFYLGAIISYLYYLEKNKGLKPYLLCLGLFILSLLSKSMALSLPAVLCLFDYYASRKIKLAVFLEKIPYFILAFVFGLIALRGGQTAKIFYDESSYRFIDRLIGLSGDIIFYLLKACLPVRSYFYYVFKDSFGRVNLFLVIILIAAVIWGSRFTKKIVLGAGFFLLTIFPAIRFLPLTDIVAADRYAYLALIGIFYLLAEAVFWVYSRKTRYFLMVRAILAVFLLGAIIFLGRFTWLGCQAWQDSLSLWSAAIEENPEVALAYNNRGIMLMEKGEYARAYSDFILAIEAHNNYPDNLTNKIHPMREYYYLNLGNALRGLGRLKEATLVYQRLIEEIEEPFNAPGSKNLSGNKDKLLLDNRRIIEAGAYFNLANMNDLAGDQEQARVLYSKAIELNPRLAHAYDCLGTLYLKLDQKAEAQKMWLKAIESDPGYLAAYVKLARAYRSFGQEEALGQLYQKAVANNLDFFDAYCYIGNLAVDARNDREAILLYKKAAAVNPDSKEVCVSLGNAYLTSRRNKDAIFWFKKALLLDPDLAVAKHNLALAYYYAGEFDLAAKYRDEASLSGYVINPRLQELLIDN